VLKRRTLIALPLVLAAAYGAVARADGPPVQPAASTPPNTPAQPAGTGVLATAPTPAQPAGTGVLATAPTASATPAASSGAPAMTVDTLENGLTVVTVPMPGSGVVAFYTLVRAGARDEVESGRSGYAHLFEHLMFRGTKTNSAHQYEQRMQAMGADNNAFTTNDFTLYVPVIPKESLADLVPIEADRFQHLDVAENAYKDETGAVNGELNKAMANPGWFMDEALRELAFTKHTYGHTTIGYQRDVVAMPKNYAYSKTFFARFYTPDDCTLWAVGDVDHAKVLELVRANYAGWKAKRAQPKIDAEPEQKEARQKALTWKGPTTPRITLGYKIPSASENLRDVAALAVTATLVFGEPGELYQKVVVKDQKVIELGSDPDDALNKDPGLFRIDAKLKASTSFDEVTSAVQGALDAVARGEAKAADIASARTHMISALTLAMQTPGSVAERLAYLMAVTGDVRGFERYTAELRKVTAEDIARVAKAYLVPARRNVVTLSPPAAKPGGDKAPDPKGTAKATKPAAPTKPVAKAVLKGGKK
jgi:zinc protease